MLSQISRPEFQSEKIPDIFVVNRIIDFITGFIYVIRRHKRS